MIRIAAAALFSALVLGFASAASASPVIFSAVLTGPGESPPNASPGTGFAQVTFDFAANTMRVQLTFSGLLGTTTGSHIHCCNAVPFTGTSGVATTVPAFGGFPLGVTSGSLDAIYDMTLASSYNPAFVTAQGGIPQAELALYNGMLAGDTYLNIHTTVVPGGEIRGFLIPEPMTLSLFGAGLAGAALIRRRRAKASA